VIEPAATALAVLAGTLSVPACRELVLAIRDSLAGPGAPLVRSTTSLLEYALRPLRLAGEEGLVPSDRERFRLQALSAAAGFAVGLYIWGAKAALGIAIAGAWLASRALIWRRDRYRAAVDAGASTLALALADALTVGHSARGALVACAGNVKGPIGRELGKTAQALEVGATTDAALTALRERCRSRRIELICAAISVQRRSGGALAALLRRVARTIEEQDRLEDEARAASAQARATSRIVALLPFAALMLGELAAPGLLERIAASRTGLWLLGSAIALQLAGALVVARLSRLER
jgi:tight adherence protein B